MNTHSYKELTSIEKNQEMAFADFTLRFVGQRLGPFYNEKAGLRFVYDDFEAKTEKQTIKFYWTAGTGDISPSFFSIAGKNFQLEYGRTFSGGEHTRNIIVSPVPEEKPTPPSLRFSEIRCQLDSIRENLTIVYTLENHTKRPFYMALKPNTDKPLFEGSTFSSKNTLHIKGGIPIVEKSPNSLHVARRFYSGMVHPKHPYTWSIEVPLNQVEDVNSFGINSLESVEFEITVAKVRIHPNKVSIIHVRLSDDRSYPMVPIDVGIEVTDPVTITKMCSIEETHSDK